MTAPSTLTSTRIITPRSRKTKGLFAIGVALLLVGVAALLVLGYNRVHAAPASYLNGVTPVTSSAGFTHPGVYLDLPELESVRQKITAGTGPQASVYTYLTGPTASTLVNRQPQWQLYSDALDTALPCDPDSTQGCVMDAGYSGEDGRTKTDLAKQSMSAQINSAYTNALLYYYSGGNETYAQNAIRMLNAYGKSFKGFTSTASNGYVGDLFAAWSAETLVRAAEIIRYTYTPSASATAFDVEAFESMLRAAFVPRLENGTAHINNWRTSAAEGLINIGVFLDDRDLYDTAIGLWREVTPAYIYLSTDGSRPASLLNGTSAERDCSWIYAYSDSCKTSPKTLPGLIYQNGQSQEICRDMWHASAGMGGIINTAETAYLQGDDLYAEQKTRIMTGLSYMLQLSQQVETAGYPADFCANAGSYGGTGSSDDLFPTTWNSTAPLSVVVAYNHYATRQGLTFPTVSIPGYTDSYPNGDPVAAFIATNRSGPTDVRGYVTAWQVLTHYGVGSGVTTSSNTTPDAPGAPNTGIYRIFQPNLLLIGSGVIATAVVGIIAWKRMRR